MASTDINDRVAIPSLSADDHVTVYDGQGRAHSGVFMSWVQPQRGHDVFALKIDGKVRTVSISPTVTVDLDYKPVDVPHHPDMEVVRHDTLHPSLANGDAKPVDGNTTSREAWDTRDLVSMTRYS